MDRKLLIEGTVVMENVAYKTPVYLYVLILNPCLASKVNHSPLKLPFYSRTVVKLGEHNIETEIDCENKHCADPPQTINAKVITVPKEYDESTLRHDLALVELMQPANITHYVSLRLLRKVVR